MAFTPISNTVPQYEENGIAASGFYIKFYEAGTTTPTAMATDSTGGTLLDKCELNAEGYPINGSSAVFIPHIDRRYKIALFRNATDADNNNLNNAVWPVDNMNPVITGVLGSGLGEIPLNSDLRVDTISELRLVEPSVNLQKIYLNGHTNKGIGGGTFYFDASDTSSIDNNGTVIVTSGGNRWRREVNNYVNLSMFGGIGDYDRSLRTGTDNQAALEASEVFCNDSTGVELIIDGDYGVGSATTALPIFRRGIGPSKSGLFALNDNHRIYTWSPSITSGSCGMENFKIQGYAQDNTTQGGDDSALVEISPIDSFTSVGMEYAWGRQMGLKSRAKISTAHNNYLHHLLRDGINFSDSLVRNVTSNTLEYVADDAIACHSNSTNFKTKTVISDNILFNTFGIKCLSSEFTISGNRGELLFGYGVQYGVASGFAEGAIDVVAGSVIGNSFKNVLNTLKVGGGDLGAAINGRPIFEANVNGVYPGDYDTTLNAFVDPLATVGTYGGGIAHIGSLGVTIADNNVIQTWTGGTVISDYGRGEAWTTSGFQDIALTGSLGVDGNKMDAYRFTDVAENIMCRPGTTYGVTLGYHFLNIIRLRNFDGAMGQMSRIFDKGIAIVKSGSIAIVQCENAKIEGGSLDMDPMHEHPDRELVSGEPTGGWVNTGSQNCIGMLAINVRGFLWRDTSVRNMQRTATVSGGGAIIPLTRDLTAYREDGGKGIGIVHAAFDQLSIYTDSDPRNATYGDILQGNLLARSSLPSTDYYFAGQRIRNSDYSATIGGSAFTDMIRITTGNNHVLNTDWKIIALT